MADRAVSLFTNDDFSSTKISRIRVVNFITVDKQDQISILLNSALFTQVRHDGPFVGPLLERSVELRECDDGAVEFF